MPPPNLRFCFQAFHSFLECDAFFPAKAPSRGRAIDDCETFQTALSVASIAVTDSALRTARNSVVCGRLACRYRGCLPTLAGSSALCSEHQLRHRCWNRSGSDKMLQLQRLCAVLCLLIPAWAIEVEWDDPSMYFPASATDISNIHFFQQIQSKVPPAQSHMV